MKNKGLLRYLLMFLSYTTLALVLTNCGSEFASKLAGQTAQSFNPKTDKFGYDALGMKEGVCTQDANEWGHPSSCSCEVGVYNSKSGLCELVEPAGVCTQDANEWGHPSSCHCETGLYNAELGLCELADTTGVCTQDINEWGHSSLCTCPEGLNYNAQRGICMSDITNEPPKADPSDGVLPGSDDKTNQPPKADPPDELPGGKVLPIIEIISPTGICTMDINEFGHASRCGCPQGFNYNSRRGKCIKRATTVRNPIGICTMDINEFGHASRCGCPESFVYNSRIGKCLK